MSPHVKVFPIEIWLLFFLFNWLPAIAPAESEPAPVLGKQQQIVDTEQIHKLANQAKQDQGLSEATLGQIRTTYSQALEQLELSSQWQVKAVEFAAAGEAAQLQPALQAMSKQNLDLTQNQRILNETIDATKKFGREFLLLS
ncbi:MAG: hypothetical protein QNJ78_03900 [Gammaproteobacteria bacterium]|nr:hypothetical protein [Gammaproteobacteria bacterium]